MKMKKRNLNKSKALKLTLATLLLIDAKLLIEVMTRWLS
jgi:hypothetical protein